MNRRVAVIGCGIIGAMIAYELSQIPELDVLVFDQQGPAQASTGAALGVLMGIISQKFKGRNWRLRQTSIERYQTLIPELETLLGRSLPFNHQGLLKLCFADDGHDQMSRWASLQARRQAQGWSLEIWSPQQVIARCPHLNPDQLVAAIYSPQDGQVSPTVLTQALVEAARQRGATFYWHTPVTALLEPPTCRQIQTVTAVIPVDWVVLSAGLGTSLLSQASPEPISLMPVLGQAMAVQLPKVLGDPAFQPSITGGDIHLVPLGAGRYWVGATVEFPPEAGIQSLADLQPETKRLEALFQGAVDYCPALAQADILSTWSGLRPRPEGQVAPVIKPLAGYTNVTLATGHYRNGVLLAPATALSVKAMLSESREPL
jgi:glycine/D-amino acid oxidase-like deaminating enzyme